MEASIRLSLGPEHMHCSKCNKEQPIYIEDNTFSYSGTHCTGGRDGVWKDEPKAVCDICGTEIEYD